MLIRRARPDEAVAAAEIYLESRRAAGDLIPPPVHDDEDTRRWMRDDFARRAELWFAVDEDDAALALLALEGDDWLEQLYVLPHAQGQGIGAALVEHAKAQRPAGLQLWAFASNAPARAFYESHGFVAVEETDGAGNEEHAPDVRYRWTP
jgi:GNAT superfamily N-acetyltransferase